MQKTIDKQNFQIKCPDCFDLSLCLDCGQAFRWEKSESGLWHGVIEGEAFSLIQSENTLTVSGQYSEKRAKILNDYFDFERDYPSLVQPFYSDPSLKEALNTYYGIRILRQAPWEALCSFIISQNNNIPRIKGIVSRLCENFGEKIGENDYSFPSAETLSSLSVEELMPLRSGFRAKYIIDAAQKVVSGEVDFEKIRSIDIENARAELIKIKGVGAKVAECTLLYGFNRLDAFPVDVWVKRVVSELYPDGLPSCFCGYDGVAQQYLFHWRRRLDK